MFSSLWSLEWMILPHCSVYSTKIEEEDAYDLNILEDLYTNFINDNLTANQIICRMEKKEDEKYLTLTILNSLNICFK